MAIDKQDRLYIVDMTARIQVFDRDGNFIRSWQTPDHEHGRPTGMSIDRDGNLVVADTHYYQVLFYSPEGELLRKIGGTMGHGPGEFGLVTDIVEDKAGNYYVSEYGDYDRVQKFDHDGKFILQWGTHGEDPGQFSRPQGLAIDEFDHIWVADACNHRVQVFDSAGHLLSLWGQCGPALGSSLTRTISHSTAKVTSISLSSAITASKNLPSMANRSAPGELLVRKKDNCSAHGRWFEIAKGGFTCLIATITACKE